MRYAKALETDTLARDAALVDELFKKYTTVASPHNEKTLRSAQEWFVKKHDCDWKDHVKGEERQR